MQAYLSTCHPLKIHAMALYNQQLTILLYSSEWGLGRHFYYLSPMQRSTAMKWDFYSQPLAVAAAMISRAGMMWFLLTCFASSEKKIRVSIIICAIIQIVVNMVTILQIILQCGPNPYHAVCAPFS